MIIDDLLKESVNHRASDLHISVGLPPIVRIDGNLIRTKYPPLTPAGVEELVMPMLNNEQRKNLEQNWELDLSYGIEEVGRFRVNICSRIQNN